jgi:hypothetical protein
MLTRYAVFCLCALYVIITLISVKECNIAANKGFKKPVQAILDIFVEKAMAYFLPTICTRTCHNNMYKKLRSFQQIKKGDCKLS